MDKVVIGALVTSEKFNYFPEQRRFVSEISDTGYGVLQPVYTDGADIGFVMVSAKTGNEKVFVYTDSEVDNEGELIAYHFHSDCGQYTACIYND